MDLNKRIEYIYHQSPNLIPRTRLEGGQTQKKSFKEAKEWFSTLTPFEQDEVWKKHITQRADEQAFLKGANRIQRVTRHRAGIAV